MKRPCSLVPEWLEARREHRLEVPLRRQLSRHLDACDSCRQWEAETEPLEIFAPLAEGPLPAGVSNYILGGIRVEEERPAHWWSGPSLWPALASMAAAAALLFAWAIGGTRGSEERPGMWLEAHAMEGAVTTVEDISSETAEVFALSLPQSAGGRAEVILIVDRSIDL